MLLCLRRRRRRRRRLHQTAMIVPRCLPYVVEMLRFRPVDLSRVLFTPV